MDENRADGSIEEVKGAAKDAIGWAVSDTTFWSDGEADKAGGKTSELWQRLERRGARRRSHEVRGPPRSELKRVGRRAMSANSPIILLAILLGGGYDAHSPRS